MNNLCFVNRSTMGRADYSFGSRTVFSEWASISYLLEVILSLEIAVYIVTNLEIFFAC